MIPMLGSLLALAAIGISSVRADFGPYFQSTAYDEGKYGAWPTETYRSTAIIGPSLNYVQYSPACNDGQYTLIAPRGGSVRYPGPMIIDQDGHLVWTKYYGQTYNLNIYRFKGQDYLTFWVGDDGIVGHGDGTYYMLDSSYQEAYKIRGANGLPADLHEFHITRDETAVFSVYEKRPADLQSAGGPEDGWIWDGTFQEVDIETGALLFQWRASEHFNFTDVYRGFEGNGDSPDRPWDFFHINSIDKDAQGNFLISARYTNCLTYIDSRTGAILWRLGGKHNDFTDLSDGAATNITWQHHARFRDNDTAVTIFDNASRGVGAPTLTSRGLYLDLDTAAMTVAVRHEYWNAHDISSQSQGSVQILDSGNVLLGYGFDAAWTEYSIAGDVLCHVHFGPESGFGDGNIISYRVFKHPWVGRPTTAPDLAVWGYEAAVSWNGATEVATWVLEGTDDADANLDAGSGADDNDDESSDPFTFLTALPKSGFETVLPIPDDAACRYLRVLALNSTGHVLTSTKLVEWDPTADEAAVSHGDEEGKSELSAARVRSAALFTGGFFSAIVLVAAAWAIRRHVASRAASRPADDKERGSWRPLDGFNGDEDLSDGEISDGIEFSLMGNGVRRESREL
ncbi:ASST-domain-containing protein [Aspergillus ambiguus]|uniref:arylsulfotransferase family protein n=1 Tax=Aspergillus ambiguus TaxID=176160 RepID=UPI003CCD516D